MTVPHSWKRRSLFPRKPVQSSLLGMRQARLIRLKVSKGSLVHVIGAQELEKFKRKDGSEGMAPKITLYDLEYIPGNGKKEVQPPAAQQPPDAGNDEIEEIRVSGDKLPF